jgi:hypothetical protein
MRLALEQYGGGWVWCIPHRCAQARADEMIPTNPHAALAKSLTAALDKLDRDAAGKAAPSNAVARRRAPDFAQAVTRFAQNDANRRFRWGRA